MGEHYDYWGGDDTLREQVVTAMTSVDVDGYRIGSALPARTADRVLDATADAVALRVRDHVAEVWEAYEACRDARTSAYKALLTIWRALEPDRKHMTFGDDPQRVVDEVLHALDEIAEHVDAAVQQADDMVRVETAEKYRRRAEQAETEMQRLTHERDRARNALAAITRERNDWGRKLADAGDEASSAVDEADEARRARAQAENERTALIVRAEEAEQQRDENLRNVRKVDDLRMAEIGKLNNTLDTLRSYAEARSKSTNVAVQLTAEGVLRILGREAGRDGEQAGRGRISELADRIDTLSADVMQREAALKRVRAICDAVEYKESGQPDTYTSYAEDRHDPAAEVSTVIDEDGEDQR